jgi:hypothetical protein
VTSLESILRRISADLNEAGLAFALVGGLAVSARAEPRFTRDADLAVAVSGDPEAEALIHNLRSRYRIETVIEQEAVGRLATVRLAMSADERAPVVDLLFASSGIEPEIVSEAETMILLHDLTMPVARTGHLIALKVLSRDDVTRPQDLQDLRALVSRASADELDRAQRALELISTRGYDRARNLSSELRALLDATAGGSSGPAQPERS